MNLTATSLFSSACLPTSTMVNVLLTFDRDLASLMPYLNGSEGRAQYHPEVPFIKFMWKGHWVIVQEATVRAFAFDDDRAATQGGQELAAFLEDYAGRLEDLEPDPTPFQAPSVLDIYKLLPKIPGCKECGQPSCMAFAGALVRCETELDACLVLTKSPSETRQSLQELLSGFA